LPDTTDAILTIEAYFRYVSKEDSKRLYALFSQGARFFDVITSEAFYNILPKARESRLLPAMDEVLRAESLMDTLDVLAKSFYGLSGMIGSLEDVIAGRAPLGEIYELAADFQGNTADFVRTVQNALDRAKMTSAGEQKDKGVGLLTYFRAKGLQWHTVILTTCNEGVIPHKKAPVEEERRLFYVALTRVTSNLFISYVTNCCNTKVSPSRFLYEAGLLSR
jgi:DNA helicase-2/ATP-dependent DNA helicase PcrA